MLPGPSTRKEISSSPRNNLGPDNLRADKLGMERGVAPTPCSSSAGELAAAWDGFLASRKPETRALLTAVAQYLVEKAATAQNPSSHSKAPGSPVGSGKGANEEGESRQSSTGINPTPPSVAPGGVVLKPITVAIGAELAEAGKIPRKFTVTASRVFNPTVGQLVSHPALQTPYRYQGKSYAYPSGILLPRGATVES